MSHFDTSAMAGNHRILVRNSVIVDTCACGRTGLRALLFHEGRFDGKAAIKGAPECETLTLATVCGRLGISTPTEGRIIPRRPNDCPRAFWILNFANDFGPGEANDGSVRRLSPDRSGRSSTAQSADARALMLNRVVAVRRQNGLGRP
jgi:hypothetical protein